MANINSASDYKKYMGASAGGNLTIGDLSIGVSAAGAQEYYQELKTNAIDKACDALRNTSKLYSTFRQSWQGQAELNFERNFDKAISETIKSLEGIKVMIENNIAREVKQWAEEDKHMLDVY